MDIWIQGKYLRVYMIDSTNILDAWMIGFKLFLPRNAWFQIFLDTWIIGYKKLSIFKINDIGILV